MLQSVQVDDFKSLASTQLEVGRVNVFVGANGVGKSNLLEAIGVLGAAADGQVDDAALLRRGVRPGMPAIYKSSFMGQATAPQIGLLAASEGAEYAVRLRNPLEHPTSSWTYFSERLDAGDDKLVGRSEASKPRMDPARGLAALELAALSHEHAAARLVRALQGYRIYSPDTPTLRGLVVDVQQQDPVGLSGGRLAEAVQSTRDALAGDRWDDVHDTVLELLDWVEDFDVAPAASTPMSRSVPTTPYVLRFRDRYMRPDRRFVSGYEASEGAVLVLFLMVLALHRGAPRIFAVDNVDHGLNPRLARRVVAELADWILADDSRQVFLTAHNPLVLDGLRLQDDRVRLFTVDRSKPGGRTVFRRIVVTDEMRKKAGEGWSLSRMWTGGLLGGVPDV